MRAANTGKRKKKKTWSRKKQQQSSPFKTFESIEGWLKKPEWNGESMEEDARAAYWAIKERALRDTESKWSKEGKKDLENHVDLEKLLEEQAKKRAILEAKAQKTEKELETRMAVAKQDMDKQLKEYDRVKLAKQIKGAIETQEMAAELESQLLSIGESKTQENVMPIKNRRERVVVKRKQHLVYAHLNKQDWRVELVDPKRGVLVEAIHVLKVDRSRFCSPATFKEDILAVIEHHDFVNKLFPPLAGNLGLAESMVWKAALS